MLIKVYLDDERNTPEGWERAYTVPQCMALLGTRQVSHLSLDNDLGSDQVEGFTVLNLLEEMVYFDPTFPIPIITIHSANPARALPMRKVAEKLELIRQQQTQES